MKDLYAELFITYPGHPYLAIIDGVREDGHLNRIFLGSVLYHRRVGIGSTRQYEVHRVPLIDAIYEIGETHGGRRTQRYVATRKGDRLLYPLSCDQVEAIAEGTATLGAVVEANISGCRITAKMKASQVLSVWLRYGVPADVSDPLVSRLHRVEGDFETDTTLILMWLSEAFERENKPVVQPPEWCTSCRHEGEHSHLNWTYGHRPGWWVCAQCHTVLPCRCEVPNDKGECRVCFRRMTDEQIEAHRAREATLIAEVTALETPYQTLSSGRVCTEDPVWLGL